MLFPETWWGLHYPSFLSGAKGAVIIFLAIALTLYGQQYSFTEKLQGQNVGGNKWIWTIALAFLSGLFFNQLPIYEDVYGDAMSILKDKDLVIPELTPLHDEMIFSLDFTNLKLGTGTTLGIVTWLSYSQEITVYEAFKNLGIFCGVGYVFFMMASVFRIAKDSQQRLLLSFLVLGSPFFLVFCGHIEVYAPVYFILAIFWYVLIRFLEKMSFVAGFLLILVAFLHLKFHITGAVSLLVTFTAILVAYREKVGCALTWKQLTTYIVLPVMGVGASIYLFVTKSMFGPRDYSEDSLNEVLFLPLRSSDPAPLDRYNLFSWNHIFDYFNLTFLWSASAVLIIVVALIFKRKSIHWNNPLVQISGVATIFFTLLFFVLNPLLAMPKDWDLMSIPAVALVFFAATIITASGMEKKGERTFSSFLIGPVIGLFLISLSGLFVNANLESERDRLLVMGKYNFKTYWIGSSSPILESLDLIEEEEKRYQMLEKTVEELEPYAVMGNDVEFAALQNEIGNNYQNYFQNLEVAHSWYLKAYESEPLFRKNVYDLIISHFIRKEFKEANVLAPTLVKMKYPTDEKSLRMAVHISLEAEDYSASAEYCKSILSINSKDDFIKEILELLQTSEDKSKIKLRFRQS
ncbi:MAG: hypothetical protein Crog4KO_32080 [Crocinitomicaceae bacterium]